jgi:hypothetical protein
MDRIVSDRAVKIIVIIIAIIVVADIANVFVLGGPSVVSLIFKPGGNAAATNSSLVPSVGNVQATPMPNQGAGSSGNSISAIYVPTTATPIPTVQFVNAVTPIQTQDTGSSLAYVMPTAQTTSDPAEDYVAIYSNALNFTSADNPQATAFVLANPPLVINYTVDPLYTTDAHYVYNHTATHAGAYEYQNVTRPSEHSWFTITVYDKDTGQQLDQTGYGGLYSWDTQDTYTFRQAGNLLIQFDGENINAQVDMFIKKEGNIAS